MAASASNHNKKVRQLSFKASVQLLSAVQVQLSRASKVLMFKCYDCLLKALASTHVGKRKRPPQPREIKRRPKAYPLMTKPRSEGCEQLKKSFCTS
jgi:hypothetical protein